MALALRHIGVVVSDLDKALDIFINYLGCRKVVDYPELTGVYYNKLLGIRNAQLRIAILETDDSNRIELIEYINPLGTKKHTVLANDIGVSHLAITVKNIEKLFKLSSNYDVKFISKPIFSLDGKVKVAYAVVMQESIIELVEVIDSSNKPNN